MYGLRLRGHSGDSHSKDDAGSPAFDRTAFPRVRADPPEPRQAPRRALRALFRAESLGEAAGLGMIIAIDGPAASGKGTIARRIAAHYRLPHLDTGLLYRAAAAALDRRGPRSLRRSRGGRGRTGTGPHRFRRRDLAHAPDGRGGLRGRRDARSSGGADRGAARFRGAAGRRGARRAGHRHGHLSRRRGEDLRHRQRRRREPSGGRSN